MKPSLFQNIGRTATHGIVFGLSAVFTIILVSLVYATASWGSLPTVQSGSGLTATAWNDLVAHVNQSVKQASQVITVSGSNVGIGTTSPGQNLSVSGIIESTNGGIKFPDGTSQTTTSETSATFLGGLANRTAIMNSTTSFAQFNTLQNSNSAVFEVVPTGNFGIKFKKAGRIMWNYQQDIVTGSAGNYATLYAYLDGVPLVQALISPTNDLWDMMHNNGSYNVAAGQTLTFSISCAGCTITSIDNGIWARIGIFWMGQP
ncbi:MAG: hypothetical protein PHQ95_01885 [Candidatus Gracilibacteria bacterium]|nr:hypothetical protein [Candidatus Gracilibacteria bacterium]